MIRSMTAYGRSRKTLGLGTWEVEIHSVNRKAFDVNISIPKELLFLDVEIRKLLSEEVERGQVSVKIYFEPLNDSKAKISRLKGQKKEWDKIAKGLHLDPEKEVTLSFLLGLEEKSKLSFEEGKVKKEVEKPFLEALSCFVEMRKKEGAQLSLELTQRLENIMDGVKKIEKSVPVFKKNALQKLKEKLKELSLTVTEERLLQETAFYVEKSDVSEEVVRLYSHIKQFDEFLGTEKRGVGKTLDFLAQEMGREINTLNAKVADSEISKIAILIKSEVEKIREQVQNIE